MREHIEQFIRDFKSAKYYNHKLIYLNLEYERLENKQMYGEHKSLALTREQLNSDLPMPTSTNKYSSGFDLETMEEKAKVNAQRTQCIKEILKCRAVDKLEPIDRALLIDKYWLNKSPFDLADDYGYSLAGVYKHLEAELNKRVEHYTTNTC